MALTCQGCGTACVSAGYEPHGPMNVATSVRLKRQWVTLCRECLLTLNATFARAAQAELLAAKGNGPREPQPPRRHA